jgi:hypothetical protein
VKPASERVEPIPFVYETVTERVLDQPAHTIWKKGRGPIEKIDFATGEIMCLVEIPATYKTITKRVLKKGPTTRTIKIPAEYKTVRRKVVATPPTTRTIKIPAKYGKIKVREMISAAKEVRTPHPARYETVTKRGKVTEGRMAWQEILCETNVRRGIVMDIQRGLKKAGHDPGPIDGVIGPLTRAGAVSYQKAKGLAQGGLTMETLKSLGVRIR